MNNQTIRITESEIRDMIMESVKQILSESEYGPNGYRIVKGGMDYTIKGEKKHSVISVVNDDGSQAYHIDTDDHCYKFFATMDGKSQAYQYPYIFDELLDAIKMLPRPS